jgi:drug/metabolite transporter (DMT)-like permease
MDRDEGIGLAPSSVPRPPGSRADTLTPSLAILVSTLFWGTLWIPLRRLDAAGLGGPWAPAAGFTVPLLVLLPVAVARWRPILAGGWPLAQAGFLMATCLALYAEALLRGYVARVVLLFYLTPVWSTVLARVVLGDRITGIRVVTVALGLLGMFVVFSMGSGLPIPRTVAEWMGLLSGFLWAASLVSVRRLAPDASDFDKVFVLLLFAGVVFVLVSLVPGGRAWVVPTAAIVRRSATWLLLFGLIWMPIVLCLTMFGGSRLDPGRVAVLLMLEVVIALASAAALTSEPFGLREFIGAVFIVAACGSEFFARGPEAGNASVL